jgi:hypothetical protein
MRSAIYLLLQSRWTNRRLRNADQFNATAAAGVSRVVQLIQRPHIAATVTLRSLVSGRYQQRLALPT